ncbi:unnamed protein product [Ranitomeya imitator]|uniref:Uncharacterized protein n=1 Tax=Ranitomeya imitator TaxID=111125 RepID=A0ABN9M7C4_9NEOB|nr:unnamed protein product [Ranitomeya imitator]
MERKDIDVKKRDRLEVEVIPGLVHVTGVTVVKAVTEESPDRGAEIVKGALDLVQDLDPGTATGVRVEAGVVKKRRDLTNLEGTVEAEAGHHLVHHHFEEEILQWMHKKHWLEGKNVTGLERAKKLQEQREKEMVEKQKQQEIAAGKAQYLLYSI